jgi:hypothetical protein
VTTSEVLLLFFSFCGGGACTFYKQQLHKIRLVIAKLECPSSVRERIQKSLFQEKAKTKTQQ